MIKPIHVDFDVATSSSQSLNLKIATGSIQQDSESNINAVPNGYTQGTKGLSLGTFYEGLLGQDAAKIGNLATSFKEFDQAIAQSMKG